MTYSRRVPWYQQAIVSFGLVGTGFLAFGAVLDSIGNAIALISPTFTYIGTAAIAFSAIVIRILLKMYPLQWLFQGGVMMRVKRVGINPMLIALGVILLLWVPRMINSRQSSPANQELTKLVAIVHSPTSEIPPLEAPIIDLTPPKHTPLGQTRRISSNQVKSREPELTIAGGQQPEKTENEAAPFSKEQNVLISPQASAQAATRESEPVSPPDQQSRKLDGEVATRRIPKWVLGVLPAGSRAKDSIQSYEYSRNCTERRGFSKLQAANILEGKSDSKSSRIFDITLLNNSDTYITLSSFCYAWTFPTMPCGSVKPPDVLKPTARYIINIKGGRYQSDTKPIHPVLGIPPRSAETFRLQLYCAFPQCGGECKSLKLDLFATDSEGKVVTLFPSNSAK